MVPSKKKMGWAHNEELRKCGTPRIFVATENKEGILQLHEFMFAYMFQDVTSE